MRIIGILLALLLVAYLINQQLGSGADRAALPEAGEAAGAAPPQVPTRPEDIDQFEKDMNSYLNEQAEKIDDAIDDLDDG